MSTGSPLRMLAVLIMSLVDAIAAIVLSGSVLLGLVVIVAGGWATAQHDHLYIRARAVRGGVR